MRGSHLISRFKIYTTQTRLLHTMATQSPEEEYKVRKLQVSDNSKGFTNLLQQLTVCDSLSDSEFRQRFDEISTYGDHHVVCVVEDVGKSMIVATGSVMIERKFIRSCGKAGHIEDVVVDSGYRGHHLGKKVIEFLVEHCEKMGCYKVVLDCSTKNVSFYEKCGLQRKGLQMGRYFV